MTNVHVFSRREEIVNALTHGIGALLSIAALVILIVYSSMYGSAMHVVSFTVFGVSMFLLYIASTMAHALPHGKAKDIFEILDHQAIYIFIAGTYTPITLIVLSGAIGWTLFAIVWTLAIGGVVFKTFFVKKYLFTSTILYVAMGWLIVIGWSGLVETMHSKGVLLLALGGACYTLGAVFYVWRKFRYHHAIWHLFVIAGSTLHFFSVLFYVLPL
ncbi:MAG TPA: hemolysin III family protein [Bacillota bacterium]|nr:hemolysin III family protein [Bacillota bacterium]